MDPSVTSDHHQHHGAHSRPSWTRRFGRRKQKKQKKKTQGVAASLLRMFFFLGSFGGRRASADVDKQDDRHSTKSTPSRTSKEKDESKKPWWRKKKQPKGTTDPVIDLNAQAGITDLSVLETESDLDQKQNASQSQTPSDWRLPGATDPVDSGTTELGSGSPWLGEHSIASLTPPLPTKKKEKGKSVWKKVLEKLGRKKKKKHREAKDDGDDKVKELQTLDAHRELKMPKQTPTQTPTATLQPPSPTLSEPPPKTEAPKPFVPIIPQIIVTAWDSTPPEEVVEERKTSTPSDSPPPRKRKFKRCDAPKTPVETPVETPIETTVETPIVTAATPTMQTLALPEPSTRKGKLVRMESSKVAIQIESPVPEKRRRRSSSARTHLPARPRVSKAYLVFMVVYIVLVFIFIVWAIVYGAILMKWI